MTLIVPKASRLKVELLIYPLELNSNTSEATTTLRSTLVIVIFPILT